MARGDKLAGLGLADPQIGGLKAGRIESDPKQKVLFINPDGIQQLGQKVQVDGRHAQVLCR